MIITSNVIQEFTGIDIQEDVQFENLGFVNSIKPNTLSFLDDLKFAPQLIKNPNIRGILTTLEIREELSNINIVKIFCPTPRLSFFKLHNYISNSTYVKTPTFIHGSATVHPTAFVSEYNVHISNNVSIGPNVCIMPDVYIGSYSNICSGAVVGSEGFQFLRTDNNVLQIVHTGKTVIGSNVQIGSNSCVDKGLFDHADTYVGDNTVVGVLCYIGHCVRIEANCTVVAGSIICGSCKIDSGVYVGPNVTMSNDVSVGANSILSLGSVVVGNVGSNQRVTGNFALPHKKFMLGLRKLLK